MRSGFLVGVALLIVLPVMTGYEAVRQEPGSGIETRLAAKPADPEAAMAGLPMRFEPAADGSRYTARGRGYLVDLSATRVGITLQGPGRRRSRSEIMIEPRAPVADRMRAAARIEWELVGGNTKARGKGLEKNPGSVSYFIGGDRSKWRTGVESWGRISYEEVYPGIDLTFYGTQEQLEYDFTLEPGSSPERIRLAWTGIDRILIDEGGALVVESAGEKIRQPRPVVYQEFGGRKRFVGGSYRLFPNNRVGFEIGDYDEMRPLIIDPVMIYSTFIGGSNYDDATIMTTDAAGNIYLAGYTKSFDLPVISAVQPARAETSPPYCGAEGCWEAFVAKLDPGATRLIFMTYLGGTKDDFGFGLAVGPGGDVYVTGWTESSDFPVTAGAVQPYYKGVIDVFVTRLSADGQRLVYSTYLGGSYYDWAYSLAVDGAGAAYLTGQTESDDFPCVNPYQAELSGYRDVDAFVAKLSPDGGALQYSTYLGGHNEDAGNAIAVDAEGCAYLTGSTFSNDFPVTDGAWQTKSGGSYDVFVTKFGPDGSAPVFSTLVGGDGGDIGLTIALDGNRNIHVTGFSGTSFLAFNFPLVNPLQRGSETFLSTAAIDVIVFKLSANGDELLYSTYLGGGSIEDSIGTISVDAAGRIYLSGRTASNDFPVTANAQQINFGGGFYDGFTAIIDPSLPGIEALLYSSFLGGNSNDSAQSVVFDGAGSIITAGISDNPVREPANNFPLVNSLYPSAGQSDGFVTKVNPWVSNSGDRTPPAVTIQVPVGKYETSSRRIAISGTAQDDAGVVKVFWRNERAGMDMEDPLVRGMAAGTTAWSIDGIVPGPGLNRYIVTAVDAAGNAGSAAIEVNYHPEYLINTIAGTGFWPAGNRFEDDGRPAIAASLLSPYDVAVDHSGNVYISDFYAPGVLRIDSNGIIGKLFAKYESTGGGPAIERDVEHGNLGIDGNGNLYVVEKGINLVRKITPDGIAGVLAGTGAFEGGYGGDGGPATAARLNVPSDVTVDSSGNVYIADSMNHRIRRVDPNGVITTVAGTGAPGFSGDGGPAIEAALDSPQSLATDGADNLVILDLGNKRIRRISSDGIIRTVAGGGPGGVVDGSPATQENFLPPLNIEADVEGNIYVILPDPAVIKRIDTDGTIRIIAGTTKSGFSGDGSSATIARMTNPQAIATDAHGRIYITDTGNRRIRRLSPVRAGDSSAPEVTISTPSQSTLTVDLPFIDLSGAAADAEGVFRVIWSSNRGVGGTAGGASNWIIPGIPLREGVNLITVTAFDAAGNAGASTIEVILARNTSPPAISFTQPTSGNSFTTSRGVLTISGTAADENGIAEVRWESDRGVRGRAEGGELWMARDLLLLEGENAITFTARDHAGNLGRETLTITYHPEYLVETLAGGGTITYPQPSEGVPAERVVLEQPVDLAVDDAGNVYIAEARRFRIRKASPDGLITTVVTFDQILMAPQCLAIDRNGNLFVGVREYETNQNRIIRLETDGTWTTVAGGGINYPGDGAPATSVVLQDPKAMDFDAQNNLYLIDAALVRKVDSAGMIHTVAGRGGCFPNHLGDGGPAIDAGLCLPSDLAFDGEGNLYIADDGASNVRKIDTAGIITTIGGGPGFPPIAGSDVSELGDGGLAVAVALYQPAGVTIDRGGNVLVSERFGGRVRRIDRNGIITTIGGYRYGRFRGEGEPATWAHFLLPGQMTSDANGNVYLIDQQIVRKLVPVVPSGPTIANVSAASYGTGLAPESIAAAFGANLASGVLEATGQPLPLTLGGTGVAIKDSAGIERAAPLFFVSPGQINYQIPAGTAPGTATVIVDNNGVKVSGIIEIIPVAPALFSANADGRGVAASILLRVRPDGSQSFEPVFGFDAPSNRFVHVPIDLEGDQVYLLLFGTGIRFRSSLSSVEASLAGNSLSVLYAGPQGDFVGLDQVNLLLPRRLAGSGRSNLIFKVDGLFANFISLEFK
ncbi:MAG: SBBP repeat-containing protein [Acidobacteriota bacterium]|nr:MAG: SBBP repeat-containing protein [Acidobacteriota bacterium]